MVRMRAQRKFVSSPWLRIVLIVCALAGGSTNVVVGQRGRDRSPKESDGFALVVGGDTDAKIAPVAGRLTELFFESYPKLVARFEHPEKRAKRQIRLVFSRDLKIPGYCTGDTIVVSVP
jgi:hypothetical protein